jgi:hypothetical protein
MDIHIKIMLTACITVLPSLVFAAIFTDSAIHGGSKTSKRMMHAGFIMAGMCFLVMFVCGLHWLWTLDAGAK